MKLATDILGELVEHVCVLYPVNNTVLSTGGQDAYGVCLPGRVKEVYFINISFT